MNKAELAQATEMAQSDVELNVDDEVLHGLYLPEFENPVFTTIPVVAKFIRYHCLQFNGQMDANALNEMCNVARRKIRIVA